MEPDREDAPALPTPPSTTPSRDGGALVRLRERVEAAADEIVRLRVENAQLAERVMQLGDHEGPSLPMSGDPAALRASIQGFIDAVDRVLADSRADSGS